MLKLVLSGLLYISGMIIVVVILAVYMYSQGMKSAYKQLKEIKWDEELYDFMHKGVLWRRHTTKHNILLDDRDFVTQLRYERLKFFIIQTIERKLLFWRFYNERTKDK